MDTKPGYKTTEFWLSLAATIMGFVMASGIMDGLGDTHWAVKVSGAVMTILSALGYTASRAAVKQASSNADAALFLSDTSAPDDVD
jgi:hypothetical protein